MIVKIESMSPLLLMNALNSNQIYQILEITRGTDKKGKVVELFIKLCRAVVVHMLES